MFLMGYNTLVKTLACVSSCKILFSHSFCLMLYVLYIFHWLSKQVEGKNNATENSLRICSQPTWGGSCSVWSPCLYTNSLIREYYVIRCKQSYENIQLFLSPNPNAFVTKQEFNLQRVPRMSPFSCPLLKLLFSSESNSIVHWRFFSQVLWAFYKDSLLAH